MVEEAIVCKGHLISFYQSPGTQRHALAQYVQQLSAVDKCDVFGADSHVV